MRCIAFYRSVERGIDVDVSDNAVFSLSSGGTLTIADDGSASLLGGSSGSPGSILVSSSQTVSSGNLNFNYTTDYYGNGSIVNSSSGSGRGYTINDSLNLDYGIVTGYGTSSLFDQSFYNAYNDRISLLRVSAIKNNTVSTKDARLR
jgi:hypothetical protein